MNWESCNFEEEDTDQIKLGSDSITTTKLKEKNEEQKVIQLKRYLDPAKDAIRQSYSSIMSKFIELQTLNTTQEIADTLLAEDCKTFIFCSRTERPPVLYATEAQGFVKLFEDIKVKSIRVQKIYADIEKKTGFQISNYEVSYGNDDIILNEIVINIFTFNDERICKLRTLFAHHTSRDFLVPSSREKMFAKVKEINFALAGSQPDLQRVSSMFSENTVYRIWRWDDQKSFAFSKDDLCKKFKDLEEDYVIKCIIPYEITFDREFVVSRYEYDLEKKSTGQKYQWFTTCIYAFDEHINLVKASQQGELFPEEDAINPFELFSKDKLEQIAKELFSNVNLFKNMKLNFDWFYHDLVQTSVDLCRLVPDTFPNIPTVQGMTNIDKFLNSVKQDVMKVDWIKLVDLFVDQQGESYDTIFVLLCGQGTFNFENYKYKGQHMNFMNFCRLEFENGKVLKIFQTLFEIPYAILSPYDDREFSAINLKSIESPETS